MFFTGGGVAKVGALTAAKLAPLLKGGAIAAAFFGLAVATGLPIHDPWFDLVCIMAIGAFVGGEPEPDLWAQVKRGEMTVAEFLYLWFYRSTHLFISAATAYLLHKNKWSQISGSNYPEVDRRRKPTDAAD